MFGRLFPRQLDNDYRGSWLALLIFVPVMLVKAIQGVNSIFLTHMVMTSADGIPIDSYAPDAAQTVIVLFLLLGLNLLIIPFFALIALIRYRAMVPLVFLASLLAQGLSRIIVDTHTERTVDASSGFAGHPIGFWINVGILALTAIGFLLSLQQRSGAKR